MLKFLLLILGRILGYDVKAQELRKEQLDPILDLADSYEIPRERTLELYKQAVKQSRTVEELLTRFKTSILLEIV